MTACLFVFGLAWLSQLIYWGRYLRIPAQNRRNYVNSAQLVPVSVIVCFRDEEATLRHCVTAILKQEYPSFELLLVDDGSTDRSVESVSDLLKDSRVRLLSPGETRAGKKDALTFGIASATYDRLVLTDADCVAASSGWLGKMAAPLSDHELTIGLSPYRSFPGVLSEWQRFEATYTALQYVGFAAAKMPYMGVGRNLAYRKSFFRGAGGFTTHDHLAGGDDDLLVSNHARHDQTFLQLETDSWTLAGGPENWRGYLRQKLRHHAVSIAYPGKTKLLLGWLALSHFLSWGLGLALLFTSAWLLAAAALMIRLELVQRKYRQQPAQAFSGGLPPAKVALFDLALIFYYPFVAFGPLLATKRW